MGQEIVYCSFCGERILESDFKKGKAVTILKKNYCLKCAKDVPKTDQSRKDISPPDPAQPPPRMRETRRIPFATKPARLPIPIPFMIAIGIGILVLILLFVVFGRSGR